MVQSLEPTTLLRRAGPPRQAEPTEAVTIHDRRLLDVLSPDACTWVLHEAAVHVEGPVWQPSQHRLLFSDTPNRRLNAWREDGRVEVVLEPTWFINGNALASDGAVYHCEHGRRCLARSEPGFGAQPVPVATHSGQGRLNSPNDVVVGPDGGVWFTDPVFGIVIPSQGALADPELDHRSVYRLDPATGELRRMADFEQPNGLAFSPDGRTLYVSDASVSLGEAPGFAPGAKHEIQAFDVAADGALSNRRLFRRIAPGYADGFKVDRRGWVWTSAGDGVEVLDADGRLMGRIPVGAPVANVAFGGADGRRLFMAASTRLLAIDLAA